MTKAERNKLLKKAYELLDEAYDLLNEANDEEQSSLENWAENLQCTDRYERAEHLRARVYNAQTRAQTHNIALTRIETPQIKR